MTRILAAIALGLFLTATANATLVEYGFGGGTSAERAVATSVDANLTASDWMLSDNGSSDNATGGFSSNGGGSVFVRSSDATPNTTNPTSNDSYHFFTLTIDSIPAGFDVLNITTVTSTLYGTSMTGSGDNYFTGIYADVVGFTGTGDRIGGATRFQTNAPVTVVDDVSNFTELQGLTAGTTIEFRTYFGDNRNSNGKILRMDDFIVDGEFALAAIPEPTQLLFFSVAAVIGCLRSARC